MKNSLRLTIRTIRKIRYFFLFLFAFLLQPLFSQSVFTYDSSTPEVGSLLRVQDTSVNLYTGRPNISIPLHTISLKNFSYDIQLLYNAEGNKPDMPVSNVGLGWSITGGQIYRIANGERDELYTFSEYQDRIDRQDWYQESNLYQYYSPLDSIGKRRHEPDLDEFIINIGQINASFYMYKDKEGVIRTKIASQNSPYFKVKNVSIGTFSDIPLAEASIYNPGLNETYHPKIAIEPDPVLLKEITIVDSNGITYEFGGDINTVDFSCAYRQDLMYKEVYDKYGREIPVGWDYNGLPIYNNPYSSEDYHSYLFATPSTWHISKITLPNGEYIKFDYSKDNVSIVERYNLYDNATMGFYLDYKYACSTNCNGFPFDIDPANYLLNGRSYDIVYPSLLTKIHASNGDVVDFTSSKRNDLPTYGFYADQLYILFDNYGANIPNIQEKAYSYKLDEIKTKNGVVNFHYTDTENRRLQLDSLIINKEEVYKFQYNPLLLPKYNQSITDNWGYYNGKKYFIKNYLDFDNLYNFRQPDSTYTKAEILEKIIYPTGGEADFQYELHSYSKIASQYPFEIKSENGYAGGARIKKMTYSDKNHPATNQTKEYLYENENGSSSGILSVVPKYTAKGKGPFKYEDGNKTITGQYAYETKSDMQMNWVDQFHMSYSRVTELLSDGSKTIYSFINHDRIKDEPSVGDLAFGMTDNLQRRYTSKKLSRGLPHSIEYYNASKKILKKELFNYHSDISDHLNIINHFAFMNLQPIRVSANKIYTYFPFLQKKETTFYTDCDSINETEEYEYNQYRLLTNTKKYTNAPSDNSMLETRTKYLSDLMEEYDSATSGTITSGSPLKVYDIMSTRGMLSYPIETVVKRNGKVTSAEVMTYKLSDQLAVQAGQYKLETNIPLSDYSSCKLLNATQYSMDNRCTLETEYLDYDSYGNPKNVVDRTGVNTAYIWGYKGLYPIAKAVNAQNTFKSIPQYRDVWTTEYINLRYSPLSSNVRNYNFYTSQAGNVEIILAGALGFNWYVSGRLDGNRFFNLVQMRSLDTVGSPWTEYKNAYTYKAIFYVPAGYHTFSILSTDACKEKYTSIYDGDIHFSYWKKESIEPETSGADDVFYENFETTNLAPGSFGYHSSNSHIGPYAVPLMTNPQREYAMDYQVFRGREWEYVKRDFKNNCDSIDEGVYPIDDVRVYPKDASITTYNYYPLIGLRSISNERGVSESYTYDDRGRLAAVMDKDMNALKKYDYFYQNQSVNPEVVYYNPEVREVFTRNTCDASLGEIGESIQYVVPVKKHKSSISQEDANRKAYTDLLINGQQYANENAACSSNIIVSVYNPMERDYYLTLSWGVQGSIVTDCYEIPPSKRIAETGDVLKDYEPTKVYIPRRYYRNASVAPQDDYWAYEEPSVKSTPYTYDLNYRLEDYTSYEDIYVIGGYPFTY